MYKRGHTLACKEPFGLKKGESIKERTFAILHGNPFKGKQRAMRWIKYHRNTSLPIAIHSPRHAVNEALLLAHFLPKIQRLAWLYALLWVCKPYFHGKAVTMQASVSRVNASGVHADFTHCSVWGRHTLGVLSVAIRCAQACKRFGISAGLNTRLIALDVSRPLLFFCSLKEE